MVLLKICCSLQQRKNFANRSTIQKVIVIVRVAHFFDSLCRHISPGIVVDCFKNLDCSLLMLLFSAEMEGRSIELEFVSV